MPTNIKLNNLPIGTLTAIADQLQGSVESILNSTGNNGLPTAISVLIANIANKMVTY